MGNLITETPYSEITATLEVLSRYGLSRNDLLELRRNPHLAQNVVRLIQAGSLGALISALIPKFPAWEIIEALAHNARRPIEDLRLSARSFNALHHNQDISYIWQLLQYSEPQLLRVKNLGETSLNEIKEKLAQMGLELGMRMPDGEPPTD